jgi:tetratricopeptide (TPR) repeat protein
MFELPIDRQALAALPYPVSADHPLVCLDLETTGLATAAGTLAFLVGLGSWDGDRLTVRQLLLPDHADERALLDALADALPADAWLVTYNGRSFDWPLLVARFRLHRRAPPPFAGHFDLLPVARQLWKHRLGNARLATVEDALCAVVRQGDLPGALVPERYFGYLRSRRGELLRDVVEHNRQDIVSLGLLLAVLGRFASPGAWPALHPGDLAGLARAFSNRGRLAESIRAIEAAMAAEAWAAGVVDGARIHRHLSAERARLLARLGRREEAHAAWSEIAQRGGPGAALAWLHVARYREHVQHDVAGALAACHEAAAVAERARAWDRPMLAVESDLGRRLPRLRRKSFARRPISRGVGRAA